MVLRKPYAFLIKHFRLIHLCLFGLVLYITIATKPLINIFGNLADQGKLNYYDQIGIFVYFAIILSIIFGIAMFFLMIKKAKPKSFYLYLSLYYVLFLLSLLIANNILSGLIENTIISIQTARAYYDISRIIYWPQIIFIIFSFVRAVGFDIKKFGFEKDLIDLNLSDQDREEFEVSIKFDYYALFAKLRRYLRELRYYFLENTLIIITIIIVLFIGIIITIFINSQIKNKIYSEDDALIVNNFQYSINSSYITNTNQVGEKFKDNLYYLIIDLNIKNIKNKPYKMILSDFLIKNNNQNYFPISYDSRDFVDLGITYKNEIIQPGESINKIAIFEVKNFSISDNKYILKIFDHFKYDSKKNIEEPIYIVVNLKPKLINGLNVNPRKYFGLTTKFDQSLLKKSTLKIKNYEIQNLLIYNYKKCITKDNCQNLDGVMTAAKNKDLLILDYDLFLDQNSYYKKENNQNFFNDYATIRYTVNNQSITSQTKVVNPINYSEKIALQVDSLIRNAQTIDLYITIRDQRYIISLK